MLYFLATKKEINRSSNSGVLHEEKDSFVTRRTSATVQRQWETEMIKRLLLLAETSDRFLFYCPLFMARPGRTGSCFRLNKGRDLPINRLLSTIDPWLTRDT